MVKVTKFSGVEVALNADLIETIEATPDTVITLTSGKRMMVKETVEEIVDRVIEYRRRIFERVQVVFPDEE
jgi:flagellar protein FlbD